MSTTNSSSNIDFESLDSKIDSAPAVELVPHVGAEQEDNQSVCQAHPPESCEGDSISSSYQTFQFAVIGGPLVDETELPRQYKLETRDEEPEVLGLSIGLSAKQELHISTDPCSHHTQSLPSVSYSPQYYRDESESLKADASVGDCALHDVEHKGATEFVKTEHVAVINEILPEQLIVVGERKSVSNHSLETGVIDINSLDQNCTPEALQNGDLCHKEETATEEKGHERAIHLSESKKVEQSPVLCTPNDTTCITADLNSAADVVSGSQAADRGDFQTDQVESFSVQATIPFAADITPGSGFAGAKDYLSTSLEGQSVETLIPEISTIEEGNQQIDVGGENKLVAGFSQLEESNAITSYASGLHEKSVDTVREADSKRTQDVSSGEVVAGYDQVKGTEKQAVDLDVTSNAEVVAGYNQVKGTEKQVVDLDVTSNAEVVAGYDQVKGTEKQVVDLDVTSNAEVVAGYDQVKGTEKQVVDVEVVAGYDQVKGTEKQVVGVDVLQPEISSRSGHVFSYSSAPEEEGKFSISDLVWGKVKSHPWWPGQIFDPSEASERAMKYKRKNKLLVAYFGDQTFAWNGTSSLHHFRTHFSQMEKQSNSDAFRIAIDYALDEVCRRVELRMSCACTPKEIYEKLNSQIIENAGIREEARKVQSLDTSLRVPSFECAKLLQYLKALALNINGGVNKLELKVAQGQLLSFYRLKGYCKLPEFRVYGGLLEDTSSQLGEEIPSLEVTEHGNPGYQNDKQTPSAKEKVKTRDNSSRKERRVSDGSLHSSRKEKSLSKLMSGKKAPPHDVNPPKIGFNKKSSSSSATSSDIKRKAVDSLSKNLTIKSTKRMKLISREVDTESSTPQSFKIGECFRRIASQLTGSPPILKCSGEKFRRTSSKLDRDNENDEGDGSCDIPEESHRRLVAKDNSSSEEMLTQLHLAARGPMNGYSFLDIILGFFSEFRNSICMEHSSSGKRKRYEKTGCRKPVFGNKKSNNTETSSSKTFDFEDFWTDRIMPSSPDEQPLGKTMERKAESQFGTSAGLNDSTLEAEHPFQSKLVMDSEVRNIDDDYDPVKEKPSRRCRKRKKKTQLVDDITAMDAEFPSPSGHEVVKGNTLSRSNDNMCISELSPTELSMSFTDPDSIPSEMNLNKIFRRFGPLKESETEVLKDTNSARVVFKKQTDAEVAFNSAAKFSIFGPVHVSYQLRFKGKF